MQISFEPVTRDRLPLLKDWLEAPHMREWWGEPEEELGFIEDMVEGRDTSQPFIFKLDGEPTGYIQYWFLGHHQNEKWLKDNPWLAAFPPEAIGVDLLIGKETMLSKGVGSATLRQFTSGLAEEGYETIIIDPDTGNGRAIRAYEKAGYRPVPELKGKTGDTLIMKYHPEEICI